MDSYTEECPNCGYHTFVEVYDVRNFSMEAMCATCGFSLSLFVAPSREDEVSKKS